MNDALKQQIRIAVVVLAPLVLAIGFVLHPYISDFTDSAEAVADLTAAPTLWEWSHLVVIIGAALLILALFAIRLHLRTSGEDTWSFVAVGLLTPSLVVLAGVTGLEGLGASIAVDAGASPEAFFDETNRWLWLFFLAVIVLSLGTLALAASVWKSEVLSRGASWLVVIALVVAAVANFVPASWGSYVIATALIVGLWTLAGSMPRSDAVPTGTIE